VQTHGFIAGIEYFLPARVVKNEDLSELFSTLEVARISAKSGIAQRGIASDDECASDLAVGAARKLFNSGFCKPSDIDYVLFCTQSPDFALPTTACILQHRLGIPSAAGALDFNLGCSGFVYGLGLSEGLISTGQARCILLLTGETYSKYIKATDRTSRAIFGDGAAATLIRAKAGPLASIGPFVYGTDGSKYQDIIVPGSGSRKPASIAGPSCSHTPSGCSLQLNGNKVFQFAVSVVPNCVQSLLGKCNLTISDIDLFVFHQANAYILEEIRRILQIPIEKMQITLEDCANTVSSTIPIALSYAQLEGALRPGDLVVLAGFGVGLSWAATLVKWDGF
jgi:3-oxoacyl-[acyl-carrier-protein] synthase-3